MANRKNLRSNLGAGVGSAISDTAHNLFHDNGDGTFDEAQGAHNYIYVGGQWVKWDGSLSVASVDIGVVDQGAPGASPWLVAQSTGQGHSLSDLAISQGATGTTQLLAAVGAFAYKITGYVVIMDAAGTFKFTDGTSDLTGAMPVATNGGVVVVGQASSPVLNLTPNKPFKIVTTSGKAFGHFTYFLE